MNKLFRPKCMRRMAVFMALVAPIIYLFGVSFTALNGAHGQQVFAEGSNENTMVLEFDRYVYITTADGVFYSADANNYAVTSYQHFDNSVTFELFAETSAAFNIRIFYYDSDYNYLSYAQLNNSRTGAVDVSLGYYFTFSSYLVSDDNAPVSISLTGFGVTDSDYLSKVGYSDYWFNEFFPKNNFLVQWGEIAISENPYGFAPFGYFWRYLDVNVLHLSHEQVGLMAYGYMYYASHVLLFDVGFILVTFFLTFIQKVADKIGGEDHA